VVVALYKDSIGVGYCKLHDEIKNWFGPTAKSLSHNQRELRRFFGRWGKNQVSMPRLAKLQQRSAASDLPQPVLNTVGWVDSTDFRLEGIRKTSRKHPSWSYKANGPAVRFTTICDAHCSFIKLWPGCSPKLYDGDFLNQHVDFLEQSFPGAALLADQHYRKTSEKLKKRKVMKIHVAPKKSATISKEAKEYRKAIMTARARVESPFGSIKQTFAALNKPFAEDPDQLEYLVQLGAGVHNYNVNNQ